MTGLPLEQFATGGCTRVPIAPARAGGWSGGPVPSPAGDPIPCRLTA